MAITFKQYHWKFLPKSITSRESMLPISLGNKPVNILLSFRNKWGENKSFRVRCAVVPDFCTMRTSQLILLKSKYSRETSFPISEGIASFKALSPNMKNLSGISVLWISKWQLSEWKKVKRVTHVDLDISEMKYHQTQMVEIPPYYYSLFHYRSYSKFGLNNIAWLY